MPMRHIMRHDLVVVILNQITLSLGSALVVIILANTTNSEIFGTVRYLVAVLAILSLASLPGISVVINQHAGAMGREALFDLIRLQFSWGLWALGGAFGVACIYAFLGEQEIARAFVFGGILSPIANLYLTPGLILAGMKRFILKALVDLIIIASAITGVFIGTSTFPASPSAIILSYLLAQSGATILMLLFVYRFMPKGKRNYQKNQEDREEAGRVLTYLQAPFSLIPAIEKAVVFIVLGPLALALFVIAALPTEHFKSAFRNLMQFYMLPHRTGQDAYHLIHWFSVAIFFLTLGTIALVLFILFGMPLLFEHFDEAKMLALFLVLGVLPLPIHVITINWIAERQVRALSRYATYAVASNILLIGACAYTFGIAGAVGAKIVYECILAAGLLRVERQRV